MTSERMSVSSSDLFIRGQPPWPLFPDFHGVLNDLVKQVGIIPECPDQSLPRSRCR